MGLSGLPADPVSRAPAFIGRDVELGHLTRLLTRAADRAPHTLLLRGEAGVGKSRLLAEFARQARGVRRLRAVRLVYRPGRR